MTTEHCTLDELLALRIGEAGAGVRSHIEECESCQEELDRLGRRIAALRALPARRPPRDRWPVVRERMRAERRQRGLIRVGWSGFAVAAGLAMAIGLPRWEGPGAEEPAQVQLEELVDQSRELEQALANYGPDGRVMSARAAGVIAELEDRIAAVDAGILRLMRSGARRDELIDLWRDRVRLMDVLVNTHVTRAAYVGF